MKRLTWFLAAIVLGSVLLLGYGVEARAATYTFPVPRNCSTPRAKFEGNDLVVHCKKYSGRDVEVVRVKNGAKVCRRFTSYSNSRGTFITCK